MNGEHTGKTNIQKKNKKKRVTWSNRKKTSIELVGIIERVNCEHGRSLRNV